MAPEEKTHARAQQAKGRLKELVGRLTGSDRMVGKGRIDQTKGGARQAKEEANDAYRHGGR